MRVPCTCWNRSEPCDAHSGDCCPRCGSDDADHDEVECKDHSDNQQVEAYLSRQEDYYE